MQLQKKMIIEDIKATINDFLTQLQITVKAGLGRNTFF
jgi:hypothetical protein